MALMSTSIITSIGKLIVLGAISILAYITCGFIYNLCFHPLRRFPGPILWRASRVPYCNKLLQGILPFEMLKLHKQYGNIVRIAPNELAFADPRAWKDIMGHRSAGESEMEKSPFFYLNRGATDIINAPREEHQILRRLLSHGFSDRSMREQEPLIQSYADLFIRRLHENGGGGKEPVNIMAWYNYMTFDVIGHLAFGEPFGCLENSTYHPWVAAIFQAARVGAILQVMNFFPGLGKLMMAMMPESMKKKGREHRELSQAKMRKRIELGVERPDLIEHLLQKKEEYNLTLEKLDSNAGIIIIGGSETTATLLSGVTYLLLRNPDKMNKLRDEVRSSFRREEDINFTSVSNLQYLLGCLDEALRIYPPAATGLPRMVPKGGYKVCDQYIPEDTTVAIWHWALYHNDSFFAEPEKFVPERWLGEAKFASDNKEALQPFNVGPRACIGRNLAYVEMRLILARVIWNFDLVIAEDSRDWMTSQKNFLMWEKGPLNVYATPVVRN